MKSVSLIACLSLSLVAASSQVPKAGPGAPNADVVASAPVTDPMLLAMQAELKR